MNQIITSQAHILESLVCTVIPDTLNLQRARLESIGQESSAEQFMREHYKEKWEKTPSLVRIPDEQLKLVYQLGIPLTFPSCDPCRGYSFETVFGRWTSWDCQIGAMHLTTTVGLPRILDICFHNSIPVELDLAFGKIFDVDKERQPGLSVPHSWYLDTDAEECLFRHQFVVCEQKVIGIPYYTRESEIVLATKEEIGHAKSYYELTQKEKRRTKLCLNAMFSSPDHQGESAAEKYLPEMLKEKNKRKRENWDDKRNGRLIDSQIELLRIGKPILIYDPEWVE